MQPKPNPTPRYELLGVPLFTAVVMIALALWSYDARSSTNLVGCFGASLGKGLAATFGYGAWLVPLGLACVARACTVRNPRPGLAIEALLLLLLTCGFLHLVQLSVPNLQAFGGHLVGGRVGALVGNPIRTCLGLAGGFVACIAGVVMAFEFGTTWSLAKLLSGIGDHSRTFAASLRDRVAAAWQSAELLVDRDQTAVRIAQPVAQAVFARSERPAQGYEMVALVVDAHEPLAAPAHTLNAGVSSSRRTETAECAATNVVELVKPTGDVGKEIIDTRAARRPPGITPRALRAFLLPRTTLLAMPVKNKVAVDEFALKQNAMRLEEKLAAYGIAGRVDGIHPGPVVTMYEFDPQSGTKISKITGLADDLALALEARVRVVAPIPGTARVGFELPNDNREQVYLRELLEDDRWRAEQGALPIALGKDISGAPVYGDLSQMPHLLVAGATGAGKSIGLNVMLASLLMRKSPADLRLLLIDPKVVEFAGFSGIPHLLLPVVTDMKKASRALAWAVDEMERRYQLFAAAGARNLQTYNQRAEMIARGEGKAVGPTAESPHDEALTANDAGHRADPPVKLPSIVVVVDEFADLMMVAAKHVESAVARLAQKARAAGIHLIVATQRPSVDVITGMIKANFPARISYKVSQREDSKTILGRAGAEQLLGKGDMLCVLPGVQELTRVHNAYIGEDEVKSLCDYLRSQGEPTYDESILEVRSAPDAAAARSGSESDEQLYDEAVAVVASAGWCSISQVQRALKVGYNKAAKIVERMEGQGVVGPSSGKAASRREVYVGPT